MNITPAQRDTLVEKGWPEGAIQDFAEMQPGENVGPIAIGLMMNNGNTVSDIADGLQNAYPSIQTFSDRGVPVINVSGTVSDMLNVMLDSRTLPAHRALALNRYDHKKKAGNWSDDKTLSKISYVGPFTQKHMHGEASPVIAEPGVFIVQCKTNELISQRDSALAAEALAVHLKKHEQIRAGTVTHDPRIARCKVMAATNG